MGRKGDGSIDSPAWDPEDQLAFFKNLERAREKGEYLRAKGAALLHAGDDERRDAARKLLEQAVREHPETLTIAWIHELLGDAYAIDAVYDKAEAQYREALRGYERFPAVRGRAEIKLALLITATHQTAKYREAESLVDAWDPVFKDDRFNALTVLARAASERGERREAAEYAQAALSLESDEEPDIPRHPDVGHVKTDETTLQELRKLAGK
jgi:tetratricopeptide (TPR) repeat protein